METLGDLLTHDRRNGEVAVRAPGDPAVEYTYDEFVRTAWKTAHFLSLRGVHEGSTVAVVDDPAVPAVLSLFGAAQLGAVTRFVAAPDAGEEPADVEARVLVGPDESVEGYDLPPGATLVAYTAGPGGVADPAVEPFGRSVWSENPVEPPEAVEPDVTALASDAGEASHRDLLREATAVATNLNADDVVAVRASLTRQDAVVDGILAPLVAGGSATLLGPDSPVPEPEPTLVVE